MELGCDKFPPEDELFPMWNDNQEALIVFMEAVRHVILFCADIMMLGCIKNYRTPKLFNISWRIKKLTRFCDVVHQAHRGIKGIVKDEEGNGIKGAHVSVRGVRHDIISGNC